MSKHLHLFGIGSAIVDIQLQIDEHEFQQLGLVKGSMNLVDVAQQTALLRRFAHYIPHWKSGGSAANTVIGFAQMGGRAGLGSMLGKDHLGEFYANELRELGIELYAPMLENEATGTSLIVITPDSERTMNTALAVNLNYNKEHVPEEAIKRAEWLYFEGYKFTDDAGAGAIDEALFYAKKHDTKVAISFSDTFVVGAFGHHVRKALLKTDLIFCNQAEAQAFAGTDDPDEAFHFLRKEAKHVAMTLGADGSRIVWEGHTYTIPPAHATPVDTTGAGDMYAAGVLYGLTHGYSPEEAGAIGSYAAARVISRLGARLPTEEIHQAKNEALSSVARSVV
ncbi:MAG: adenosine kinase [Bacteroidota bacterium]|nr:adenosine kinase [Candidatus Kapabacteria bacterium]MDW8221134.1 adenosine kinase [Bacteroidota bacterium]